MKKEEEKKDDDDDGTEYEKNSYRRQRLLCQQPPDPNVNVRMRRNWKPLLLPTRVMTSGPALNSRPP